MSEFFVPVPQMTADEARAFMHETPDEQYTVLDVRQDDEYRVAHLPGAIQIPLDQLSDRIKELDPKRPTLVYCRSGGRGSSGAAILVSSGFENVWNLDGGILAWKGLVAWGAPDVAMAWFDPARAEADYVALAWILEHSARQFYAAMAKRFPDTPEGALFADLSREEEGHMTALLNTYRAATGTDDINNAAGQEEEPEMEGGIPLKDALAWAEDRAPVEVLEFSVAAEANAYDRYLKIAKNAKQDHIKNAFFDLGEAEKIHLSRLTQAFQNALTEDYGPA